MKKLISIFLATMLVVSCLSFTASAATEYYRFHIDSGLATGAGNNLDGVDKAITGSYELIQGRSIVFNGWAVSTTGLASIEYSLDNSEWVDTGATLSADATVTGNNSDEIIASGGTVELNSTPRFNISIPSDGLLAGSVHTLSVRFVTHGMTVTETAEDGTEIVTEVPAEKIVFVDNISVSIQEYSISTVPVDYVTRGNAYRRVDDIFTITGDSEKSLGATATEATVAAYYTDAVRFHGWFSVDTAFIPESAFGYSIDNGDIVYGNFATDSSDIAGNNPYEYYSRFLIDVPVNKLAIGSYYIQVYCKLESGEQLILDTITISVANVGTIEEVEWDIKLDDAEYTINDLTYPGNRFRNKWTPEYPLASSLIQLQTAANGDRYGWISGITAAHTDDTWFGPYSMSIEMKNDGTAGTSSRGFVIDYTYLGGSFPTYEVVTNKDVDENGDPILNEDGSQSTTIVKTADGYHTVAGSGIVVTPVDSDTVIIYVFCLDDTTGDISVIEYAATTTANLDEFNKFTVEDNGMGLIKIFLNADLIASVTYADKGTYSSSIYTAEYNKTVSIINANGEVVASTTNALVASAHRMGIVSRANQFYFDNIDFTAAPVSTVKVNYVYADGTVAAPAAGNAFFEGAEYSFVTPVIEGYTADLETVSGTVGEDDIVVAVVFTANEPEVVLPTEITLAETSKYYVYSDAVLVAVPTSTATGATVANFLSNLASTENIQICNASGTAITSGRVSTGYTVNLLDASGVVIDSYTIAILGDFNADGRVTSTDVSLLNDCITARTTGSLDAAIFAACNTSVYTGATDKRVTSTDSALLADAVVARTW